MTRIYCFKPLKVVRQTWVLLVVALVACAGGPSAVAGSTPTAPRPSVPIQSTSYAHATILWDRWGIPHIFAPDDASLFHAFGWAQMENHADLVLRLFGEARGRSAEYWGRTYLPVDETLHFFGIPEQSQTWYDQQTPQFRSYLDAFVAGMNAYAQAHPDSIEPDLKVVLPITVTDVMGNLMRILTAFVCNKAHVGIDGVFHLPPAYQEAVTSNTGSNGWAIAPRHATGGSILLANPHLPWSGITTWMEAQLHAPGINASGAAMVGMPVLEIAFNSQLGWTHTTNPVDNCDVYRLSAVSRTAYRYDSSDQQFSDQTVAIKVLQADGSQRTVSLPLHQSIQGPVLVTGGTAVAIRAAGITQFPAYGALQEWWDMARASTFSQFQAAVSRLQIPTNNIIYADRAGHIMYLFNGEVPVRSGSWSTWQGEVPGDTSATLWTKLVPYSALPKIIDPASGWVQNSNGSPWLATYPPQLHPASFEPSLTPPPPSTNLRELRGIQMLTHRAHLSVARVLHDAFSSRSLLADRVVPLLVAAAQQQGTPLARQAASVLSHWDHDFGASSRGAILFQQWVQELGHGNPLQAFATPFSVQDPLTTPNGLGNPQAAVAALDRAAQDLQKMGLALDTPWGQVYRLQAGTVDLPASGGPQELGVFRVLGYQSVGGGKFTAKNGDGYMAVVQFGTKGVSGKMLLVYGNASQPHSPHNGDQLVPYSQNQMIPAWRSVKTIKKHLSSEESV